MRPGREMDVLVAVHLDGWKSTILGKRECYVNPGGYFTQLHEMPHYSTYLGAAWEVAEQFIKAGCAASVEGDGHTGHRACVTSGRGRFEADGDTAAHALCHAMLEERGISTKYTCWACGYKTLDEPSGSTYEICPICNWEDDTVQNMNPHLPGGANNDSLYNWQRMQVWGSSFYRHDPAWRMLRDGEGQTADIDSGEAYFAAACETETKPYWLEEQQ